MGSMSRIGTRGLGLHGIEERVRELEGEVRIRSVKGAGTTLWIRLPLAGLVRPGGYLCACCWLTTTAS